VVDSRRIGVPTPDSAAEVGLVACGPVWHPQNQIGTGNACFWPLRCATRSTPLRAFGAQVGLQPATRRERFLAPSLHRGERINEGVRSPHLAARSGRATYTLISAH
jgi:hypothetical protein